MKELRVSLVRLDTGKMQVPESVKKVFAIPELREMIISRAVYKRENNEPVLCRQAVQSLRLVSKGCLSTVTKVLEHDKEALFQLTLDQNNSIKETAFVTTHGGKLLDLFVNQMRTAQWNLQDPPTFSLKISDDFFRLENYESLRNCLVHCGRTLLKLEIDTPADGGSLSPVFPPYSLPALQAVRVNLSNRWTINVPDEPVNVANMSHLINSVFVASSALTTFAVPFAVNMGPTPQDFDKIVLPETLSKLELFYKLAPADFMILVRNPLPNLTSLSITLSETPLPDGLMYQALNNCRKTLDYLQISGFRLFNSVSTRVIFPVMEKLDAMRFKGTNIQLEPGVLYRLMASCFPKMLELDLYVNQAGFTSWTDTYAFPGVQWLQLQLVNTTVHGPMNATRLMTFSLETMQLVQRAFPNVISLTLTLSSADISGIQYIFQEMRELKALHLHVELVPLSENVDFWDALLTGTTSELMAALRACPELCQTTSFGNHSRPSLSMLTKLIHFSLADFRFYVQNHVVRENDQPLISDLAFTHGFLKMPMLKCLTLFGRFKASQRMRDQWTAANGLLSDTLPEILRKSQIVID